VRGCSERDERCDCAIGGGTNDGGWEGQPYPSRPGGDLAALAALALAHFVSALSFHGQHLGLLLQFSLEPFHDDFFLARFLHMLQDFAFEIHFGLALMN